MRRNRIRLHFDVAKLTTGRGADGLETAKIQHDYCEALSRIMGWTKQDTPEEVRAMRRAASYVLRTLQR